MTKMETSGGEQKSKKYSTTILYRNGTERHKLAPNLEMPTGRKRSPPIDVLSIAQRIEEM